MVDSGEESRVEFNGEGQLQRQLPVFVRRSCVTPAGELIFFSP